MPSLQSCRGAAAKQATSIPSACRLAATAWSSDSIVGGPAFEAGISSGMKVIGVNGRVYTHDMLEDAIKAAKDSSQPITLLVVDDDYIRTCVINYHGGARYPHLVRNVDRARLSRRLDQAARCEQIGIRKTEPASREIAGCMPVVIRARPAIFASKPAICRYSCLLSCTLEYLRP